VRCSEQFAEELRSGAPPSEFLLEAAGMVEMEDGEVGISQITAPVQSGAELVII
jgi:hypothetical protein